VYQENRKKASIIYILKILREYTDADHRMTQTEIVEKLKSEYGIPWTRRFRKENRWRSRMGTTGQISSCTGIRTKTARTSGIC